MIPWLDEINPVFPHTDKALKDPDGLLCAGGNLSSSTLISAYKQGIFPWFSDDDPILWWSPFRRCVLKPQNIHESKSLKRFIKKHPFEIRLNTEFLSVIEACAAPRKVHSGTWITQEMIEAYHSLHKQDVAQSFELYLDNKLVGGLYGLLINQVFCAESMYSSIPNASKVVLVYLSEYCAKNNIKLIDCQVENPHLLSMGAEIMTRPQYLAILTSDSDQQIS